jgi:hypothetical protein
LTIVQLHALFSRYASLTGGDKVVNEAELVALYAAEPPRGLGRPFQSAEESFALVSEWGNEYGFVDWDAFASHMRREERIELDQERVETVFVRIAKSHLDEGDDAHIISEKHDDVLTICARDIVKRSEEIARAIRGGDHAAVGAMKMTLGEAEEMVYEAKLNASAAYQAVSHSSAELGDDVEKVIGLLEAKKQHSVGALVRIDGMKKFSRHGTKYNGRVGRIVGHEHARVTVELFEYVVSVCLHTCYSPGMRGRCAARRVHRHSPFPRASPPPKHPPPPQPPPQRRHSDARPD